MSCILDFVESSLATNFGDFFIRVYKEERNLETIVLYSKNLDISKPVLVRVHSECLTGDVLGSRKCDCGKQLNKSLKIISEQSGVLIYLRQEGRGIGLFDKIRTYSLQEQGLDTYEANLAIGHQPDARTYEMAKLAIDDLNINEVRLLTNNPSKVSELSKLGINVIERVPLIIRPVKENLSYFLAKASKFQHNFSRKMKPYSFQLPIESIEDLNIIHQLISKKQKDILREICISIPATVKDIYNDQKSYFIKTLYEECLRYDFIPVLHLSFEHTKISNSNLMGILKKMAYFQRIQLNDLSSVDFTLLTKFARKFEIDLPVDDESFNITSSEEFVKLVKKYNIKICLDNSKGTGKKGSYDLFRQKIEKLLELGLNYIGIAGGFGPGNLESYFKLCKFFKFNLSIDAESQIKTDNKIDLSKALKYLSELISYREVNSESLNQTENLLDAMLQKTKLESVEILNQKFYVYPKVFHPGLFPSTEWFAKSILKTINLPCDFCEIGAGSGVISCLIGSHNQNNKVIAVDIDPQAVENTKKNVDHLGLNEQIDVYISDLFDEIDIDCKFDYIFWSMPFGLVEENRKLTLLEKQVFDPGYISIRKFFRDSKLYLKNNGKLLIGFSPDLGNMNLLCQIADDNGIALNITAKEILVETIPVKFFLMEGTIRI